MMLRTCIRSKIGKVITFHKNSFMFYNTQMKENKTDITRLMSLVNERVAK